MRLPSLAMMVCAVSAPLALAQEPACVPDDFDSAVACLDELLSDTDRERFGAMSYGELPLTHFGLGMWIRNSWIYGERTNLGENLSDMGFQHVDDMSVTIIEAYWARLRGCAFDVDASIAYYNAYWETGAWVEGEPDPETGIIPMSRPDDASPLGLEKPVPDCPFNLDGPISLVPSEDAQ